MSYLTTSLEDLQDLVVADLEGEGFAYNPLRTTWPQYLAICLGQPSAYLVKSVPKMLAELDAQYGGSLSSLRASVAQLMDDLHANIGAGGGGGEAEARVTDDAEERVTDDAETRVIDS